MNVNPVDGAYDAQVRIYHLYLNPFLKRFQEYAEVTAVEGFLNTDLKIVGNVNEAEKSIVSGRTVLNEFMMKDSDSREFLSADQIVCTLKEIDYYNESYHIDTLAFKSPYLFFQLDSVSNNILRIFKMDSDSSSADAETAEKDEESEVQTDTVSGSQDGMFYAINQLKIQSGVVDYTDNLTGQPFNYHLSEIEIDTDSIFSDADWVEINAQMLLNERGTLVAKAGFDPVDYQDGRLDISIEKFLLPDLNIYTNHYTGHSLLDGDMFYYSNSKLVSGNIESENQLILKQPTVRDGTGGLYSLPLKFALWLLSDSNGDVTLNVPVRGDLNDPEIDVWKLVWSTFKKRITDTADNPVNSLAPLVGADPKQLQTIEFEYLDTLPSEDHRQQMDWLLELEKAKEGLSIELEYFVDAELQKEALSEMAAEQLADSLDIAKPTSDEVPDAGKTEEATVGPGTMGSQQLASQYSEARFRNVRKYLDSLSSDTRIILKDRDSIAPQNTGALPNFKINFTLAKDSLSE